MTIITMTRNNCCHHARIWNKTFGLRALTVRRMRHPWINTPVNHQKIYFTLCIIKYFINIIVPNNDMTNKLRNLLIEYPEIDMEEFKNLEVNREIVEKYEGKRRTM